MSNHPTTQDVREAFRAANLHPDDLDFDDASGQAFDRWLTSVKAEVWADGYGSGYVDRHLATVDSEGYMDGDRTPNPYREPQP